MNGRSANFVRRLRELRHLALPNLSLWMTHQRTEAARRVLKKREFAFSKIASSGFQNVSGQKRNGDSPEKKLRPPIWESWSGRSQTWSGGLGNFATPPGKSRKQNSEMQLHRDCTTLWGSPIAMPVLCVCNTNSTPKRAVAFFMPILTHSFQFPWSD